MQSFFTNKKQAPSVKELKEALGTTFAFWKALVEYTKLQYPAAIEEWNFPGEKYGWSFRIKDKKRVIVYLLPGDGFFKVAMVFGQKATDEIMASNVSASIKAELQNARVYAEGRGIRIDINDESMLDDIRKLVAIKLSN